MASAAGSPEAIPVIFLDLRGAAHCRVRMTTENKDSVDATDAAVKSGERKELPPIKLAVRIDRGVQFAQGPLNKLSPSTSQTYL